jgi:hypothetical protein
MITLIDYIVNNNIKSIVQADTNGTPLKSLYSVLNDLDPKIWILVLTNESVSRDENRKSFDVVYSDIYKFRSLSKFDLLILNDPRQVSDYLEGRGIPTLSKKVMFSQKSYSKDLSPFLKNIEFIRIINPKYTWLPLGVQRFLSKFDSFASDATYVIGELNDNIRS